VRVHPSERTRETIRSRAERETFRANIFDTRDQAMVALGEMRKRREILGTSTTDAYLRVQDIHLNFGGVKALTGVSFQVHRGEITSIIGPNGAGKTSMINVVSGFYRPTRGRIFFEGADRTHLPAHRVARLGFARTFQNIALFKGMSTLDNIMAGRRFRHNLFLDALYVGPAKSEELRQRAEVEKIIDFLEIQAIRKKPVGRLPYGLQKRVELARALAAEPKVLLLDEPMAGMGLEDVGVVSAIIRDVARDRAVLMVEHNLSVVADLSDTITVLARGEVLAEGPYATVSKDPAVVEAYVGTGHG
jgi:branched-chain amino acid transport system ATP-binding protein